MMQLENCCLPAPFTDSILRRVLSDLPVGTSRAVESCLDSYTNRFMSSQDITEFLRSIAVQSKTLQSVFREHDRAAEKHVIEPLAWEPQAKGAIEMQWEREQWQHDSSVPSPEDLISGRSPSSGTSAHAESPDDGLSALPFELLWETKQFQQDMAHKAPYWHANSSSADIRRAHHDHHDLRDHLAHKGAALPAPHPEHEPHHSDQHITHLRKPSGLGGEQQHSAAPKQPWQPQQQEHLHHHQEQHQQAREHAQSCCSPIPHEELVCGPLSPSPPPSLPFDLLWQTHEWRETAYRPAPCASLNPIAARPLKKPALSSRVASPKSSARSSPKSSMSMSPRPAPSNPSPRARTHSRRNSQASVPPLGLEAPPDSLPLELMFQQGPASHCQWAQALPVAAAAPGPAETVPANLKAAGAKSVRQRRGSRNLKLERIDRKSVV